MTRDQFEAHVRAEAQVKYPVLRTSKHDITSGEYGIKMIEREAYIAARMEHEWPLVDELSRMVRYYEPGETRPEAVAKIVAAKSALSPYTTKPIER